LVLCALKDLSAQCEFTSVYTGVNSTFIQGKMFLPTNHPAKILNCLRMLNKSQIYNFHTSANPIMTTHILPYRHSNSFKKVCQNRHTKIILLKFSQVTEHDSNLSGRKLNFCDIANKTNHIWRQLNY